MTDEWTLRKQAQATAHAYRDLATYAHTRPHRDRLRPMQPHLGPQSPSPDNDWALNIHQLLVDDGGDDGHPTPPPTGLYKAVTQTQHHIHNKTIQTRDGYRLCNFIAFQAQPIAQQSPNAHQLHDLLERQEHYIQRAINKRFPQPTTTQQPTLQPATTITKLLAQQGITITRQHLHTWAKRGHITRGTTTTGQPGYHLGEVINWINKTHNTPPTNHHH